MENNIAMDQTSLDEVDGMDVEDGAERFQVSCVRRGSEGGTTKKEIHFLESDDNNYQEEPQQETQTKPSPTITRVSRLFTKRSSVQLTQQLTHQKSLRHYLTRDAIPHEDFYRNKLSVTEGQHNRERPTMADLMEQKEDAKYARRIDLEGSLGGDDKGGSKRGKVIKFGWFEGVYMRCLLNIWGVMLFLRLTWVVGQAGILEGIGIILLSNLVTLITTFSMSAVSTNGQIKGGGIYYMISRSLGPEFGGAIGLMFTLANSIAVSMYVIGFVESMLDMFVQYIPDFDGIVSSTNRLHDVRLIGTVSLVCILALAIVGMDWVTRVQKLLLVLLMFSQVDFIIGSFLPSSPEKVAKGVVGYNYDLFYDNLWSNYSSGATPDGKVESPQSFFTVFAVFFPACTGIVAGANLSGDLKDPGQAIPKGTLAAIGTTCTTYVVYALMVGAVAMRYASGVVEEVNFGEPGFNQTFIEEFNVSMSNFACSQIDPSVGRWCEYGTAVNQQMMEVISAWGPLIYAGCFAATISSAIASLVGAPRVLQALAKDKLYPYIESFSNGYGANNDPVKGYILVFGIAFLCIVIGDLNVVSGLLSNFFVAAYALINFSVFHADITKSPGWRPSFKYYNKWVSLIGTILCVVVMFLMDHVTALITFIVIICLYMCVSVRKPEVNWGSSTQAQSFVTALKAAQTLTKVDDHIKNYRPKIIVLTGDPADRPCLVDFANLITKRISLLSTIHVTGDDIFDWRVLEGLRNRSQEWLIANKIKAFHTVTRNNKFSQGVRAAIELHGLGKLSPNMVMVGFKENWKKEPVETEEYFKVLQTSFDMKMAVGILRVAGGLDMADLVGDPEKISEVYRKHSDQSSHSGHSEDLGHFPLKEARIVDSIDSGLDESVKGLETSKVSHEDELCRKKNKNMVIPASLVNVDDAVIDNMVQFRDKRNVEGTVDIYWLYDDGGLTLLIPHILLTRAKYQKCRLRVFFLCSRKDELDKETMNMATLLAKFRIETDDVIIIPDATKKPTSQSKEAFEKLVTAGSRSQKTSATSMESDMSSSSLEENKFIIPEEVLLAHKEKTNFHLRIAEVVREHSGDASLVVMTLPMVRKQQVPAQLYLAWLDTLTANMPPTLLVRGNQASVLTFYS